MAGSRLVTGEPCDAHQLTSEITAADVRNLCSDKSEIPQKFLALDVRATHLNVLGL